MIKKQFTASIWQEDNIFVAQCLEIDIASQGLTEDESLRNLKEAIELYFQPPNATAGPRLRTLEVEIHAA